MERSDGSRFFEIKYTYDLVPAIAASLPESAFDGLRRNPFVTAIEPDLEVQVVDAELDCWNRGRRSQFYMNLSHIASLKRFILR